MSSNGAASGHRAASVTSRRASQARGSKPSLSIVTLLPSTDSNRREKLENATSCASDQLTPLSMSRRRLASRIPALGCQIPLPSFPKFSSGSESNPATPVDQVLKPTQEAPAAPRGNSRRVAKRSLNRLQMPKEQLSPYIESPLNAPLRTLPYRCTSSNSTPTSGSHEPSPQPHRANRPRLELAIPRAMPRDLRMELRRNLSFTRSPLSPHPASPFLIERFNALRDSQALASPLVLASGGSLPLGSPVLYLRNRGSATPMSVSPLVSNHQNEYF